MREFRGGVAVVTGAAGGIGLGLVNQCLAEGMKVVLADLQQDPLHKLAAELTAAGASVVAVPTDVAKGEAVAALADAAFAEYGRVDLLFNNAGVLLSGFSWERSSADWQWILDINLMGVVHGIHSFVPRMLAQNSPGHIVNTSSVAGLRASPLMGPYTVGKQAVIALTETLHYELQSVGALLKTSVLCPGPVATGIADSGAGHDLSLTASSAANDQLRGFLRAGIAAGISPADCAGKVFQAIREEQFWIFTHDEFKPGYQARCASVLANANPVYEPFSI